MGAFWIVLIVLGSIIFLISGAFVFLVFPSLDDSRMDKYTRVKYAHRGLHGEGACENSLTAFKRAVDAGFGIELDVRLSKDGELVVFHDDSLLRVAGVDKLVKELTVEELRSVRLGNTSDYVPTLREVLNLVNGKVPLLIEIKMAVGEDAVVRKFRGDIDSYSGDYIVESFNPTALKIIRRRRPKMIIGLLSMEYSKCDKFKGKYVYYALEYLLCNFLFRPDFIAYDKKGADKWYLKAVKKLFSVPTMAWTVKSPEEERMCREVFDTVIFEQYIPKK